MSQCKKKATHEGIELETVSLVARVQFNFDFLARFSNAINQKFLIVEPKMAQSVGSEINKRFEAL